MFRFRDIGRALATAPRPIGRGDVDRVTEFIELTSGPRPSDFGEVREYLLRDIDVVSRKKAVNSQLLYFSFNLVQFNGT